jgi:iron complex outermembrane receptor protein
MKQYYATFLLVVLCLLFGQAAFSQTTINGTVSDASGGLPGAKISIKGTIAATLSDGDGNFKLSTNTPLPFTLVVSLVGMASQEVAVTQNNQTVNVTLKDAEGVMLNETVISASRVEERILESPVSIEKLDAVALRSTPSANFYDAVENLKGVQLNTNSLTFKSVNTRGFATFANTRFVQVIDGMDNAAPGLNFPAGNLVGISELDVQNMELVPGAASALYGPNAFNGIMFINSKSPFDAEGLSVMVRNGFTNQEALDDLQGTNWFGDFAIRYAKSYNNKFAFKINLAALQGRDWYARDYNDMATDVINAPVRGVNSPSYNGVNIYGDEVVTTINIRKLLPGVNIESIRPARTGYKESDITETDYLARSYRADAALNYRINDKLEVLYNYRVGFGNSIYQGANRYSLKNLNLQQHKIELKADNFFVRAYTNIENAGDSYDMRFAAWNINRAWKSDATWFGQYAQKYISTYLFSTSLPMDERIAAAHAAARATADEGRILPGTPEFEQVRDSIIAIADLATGAKFIDKTNLRHVEGNYNFKNQFDFVELMVGGNWRQYNLNSQGTIFNDAAGSIAINEYGAYMQASKKLLAERLKLTASIRYDKNQNFDGNFTPRVSGVLSLGERREHNIRASYQTGFRNPDTQSQFIGLNLGPITLVGGTKENIDTYSTTSVIDPIAGTTTTVTGNDIYTNSFTASSTGVYSAAVEAAVVAGIPRAQAEIDNAGLLQKANVAYIKPERIRSAELGYKTLINNKLMIDINGYYSIYNDFQSSSIVITPLTGTVGEGDAVADYNAGLTRVFQLYTNAAGTVNSYGGGINLGYSLPKGYKIETNYSYNDLNYDAAENPDIITNFNTPVHRVNVGFGNREVVKNLGFQLNFRWSGDYFWESSFGNGPIDSYNVTDLQLSYKLPKIKTMVKVGGSNIFNQQYRQAFGASTIGSQYYVSLLFDEMFR